MGSLFTLQRFDIDFYLEFGHLHNSISKTLVVFYPSFQKSISVTSKLDLPISFLSKYSVISLACPWPSRCWYLGWNHACLVGRAWICEKGSVNGSSRAGFGELRPISLESFVPLIHIIHTFTLFTIVSSTVLRYTKYLKVSMQLHN